MNQEEDRIDELLRRSFGGPIDDDGFTDTVMFKLPPRRPRVAWPIGAGVAAGIIVSCASLASSPLHSIPLHQWFAGGLAPPLIASLAGAALLSLLACWWGLSEGSRQ